MPMRLHGKRVRGASALAPMRLDASLSRTWLENRLEPGALLVLAGWVLAASLEHRIPVCLHKTTRRHRSLAVAAFSDVLAVRSFNHSGITSSFRLRRERAFVRVFAYSLPFAAS